ncbi:MAG: glycine zipper 2TM domain-containing protein [Rhodospirillales bacterium]|nr:glycine zipper 2TM domain-containing protein [Rhodospirillales bacterium]
MTCRFVRAAIALGVLGGLAGCGPDYSPNTYNPAAVQQAAKVDRGVIVGFREVMIRADGTVGAVTGGAAGGLVGSQVPGDGFTQALGALGGTVIGGLVGSTAERAAEDTKAWEYIVREPNGTLLSVTQKDKTPLAIGEHVLLIAGKQARVVPDYIVSLPEPAKPVTVPPAPPVAAASLPVLSPPPSGTAAGAAPAAASSAGASSAGASSGPAAPAEGGASAPATPPASPPSGGASSAGPTSAVTVPASAAAVAAENATAAHKPASAAIAAAVTAAAASTDGGSSTSAVVPGDAAVAASLSGAGTATGLPAAVAGTH